MSASTSPLSPASLFTRDVSLRQLDEDIYRPLESFPTARWWIAISCTGALASLFFLCVGVTVTQGIGTWGNNNPIGWGWAIVNFVFWIGIGHAGTLISAILFVFRQRWRNAISRFAEAMTIFAVSVAGIFPLIHVGRPWLGFWMFPYPNQRALWPNFRSPLLWDVFAVTTYFTISLLFWYIGLLPDIASMRDRAKHRYARLALSVLSLGWRGAASHWRHYEKAYVLLAGLATGLVISVHSVVSFDFAVSLVPGWHMTIFPPYFVTGAIFAGFAMVILALVLVRETMQLKNIITMHHLEMMNKVLLATSCLMGYAYLMEGFTAWYSMNPYLQHAALNYVSGTYGWAGWICIGCNVVFPQLLWVRRFRRSYVVMLFVAVGVTVGMWFERFVIIVISLHQDFLPSSWSLYWPTLVDYGILAGSFGIFFSMVLLFARALPVIATTEVKAVLPERDGS
jgi:Ni/Fe-hydrogenase subunit HybB-like protein